MTGTGNALATRNGGAPAAHQQAGALAIHADQPAWTDMQLAALGQLGIKDAPDGDKAVFLHVSQRTGLDPFARQIYMIGRQEKVPGSNNQWRTKWTIQTGIEGWRVIRDRAERREGVRGILSRFTYYDPEGTEYKVWVRREPPVACEVTYTVRDRNGIETPYTSVLRMDEYMQTKEINGQQVPVAQWAVKDVHMLEKCTEADVYRKAFPQDYSGVYLDDAMPAPDPDAPPAQPQRERVSAADLAARRQTVTATVVTADAASGDAPPPKPAPEAASNPDAPAGGPEAARIIGHFHRLGWGSSPEDQQDMLHHTGRIAKMIHLADYRGLTIAEANHVCQELARFGEGDAQGLMDYLDDGVVPDGQ